MAASLAGLLLLPAIPQDQSYHLFAHCRAVAGIPNFLNVVSNIPFIAIGAAGLWRFRDDPATIVLFVGFLLTGIGSCYYHWDPNDGTLFWDRLPTALIKRSLLRHRLSGIPTSKSRPRRQAPVETWAPVSARVSRLLPGRRYSRSTGVV